MEYNEEEVKELPRKKQAGIISSVICVSFNQDRSRMGIGTNLGFRVIEIPSMKIVTAAEGDNFAMDSGVSSIALLSKTILAGIVSDGTNQAYPNTNVYIWDSYNKEIKKHCLNHKSKVEAIYLTKSNLLSLTSQEIVIWNLEKNHIEKIISSTSKPNNFITSTKIKSPPLVAFQDDRQRLIVKNIVAETDYVIPLDYPEIQKICISNDGNKIAVADANGQYIDIYDILSGKRLFQFTRGKMAALVSDLAFREDDKYLALITVKGTMHLFKLDQETQVAEPSASEGIYEMIKGYVPKMLSAHPSVAKYHPDLEKYRSIDWRDPIKSKMSGPVLSFVGTEDKMIVYFESGLCAAINYLKVENGECKVLESTSGVWFDSVSQDEDPNSEFVIL